MAAIASPACQLVLKNFSSASKNPRRNTIRLAKYRYTHSTKSFKTRTTNQIRASDPEKEEANSNKKDPDYDIPFLPQEDLTYLVKLGVGSVVGAAAIKYGSVVFPEITTPNIVEALGIISFPVIAAVLVLSRQSRSE